jgi:DNA invertase Pin-like site-specific DNA recombinase
LDLSTPQGKLVANVLMSVAEWEREMIGQRTAAALAVKRADGVRLGRPPALSDEVVQRIVRERQDGRAFAAIAAGLNDDGVSTAHGGRCWYPATVAAIVRRAASHADTSRVHA